MDKSNVMLSIEGRKYYLFHQVNRLYYSTSDFKVDKMTMIEIPDLSIAEQTMMK